MPSKPRTAIFLGLALALGGCARGFRAPVPEGFAAYPGASGASGASELRCVSPEGVLYRVRTEKAGARAGLDFWREALSRRMRDAGYRLVADSAFRMGDRDGALLELAAPVGQDDWTYVIAFTLTPKKVLITESAGPAKDFGPRRAAVLRAAAGTRPD